MTSYDTESDDGVLRVVLHDSTSAGVALFVDPSPTRVVVRIVDIDEHDDPRGSEFPIVRLSGQSFLIEGAVAKIPLWKRLLRRMAA